MAISVPREVVERALRNLPPSDSSRPKFGSFGWKMASFQATSNVNTSPTPAPIPPTPPTPLPSPALFVMSLGIDTQAGTPSTEFALPLKSSALYDFTVNWGDGTQESLNLSNTGQYVHNYDALGTYTINISSNNNTTNGFSAFAIDSFAPSKDKIIEASFDSPSLFPSLQNMFYEATNLESISAEFFAEATNISWAWRGAIALSSFPAVNFVKGTDFTRTWFNCSNLTNFSTITCNEGTSFLLAWANCSALSTFPALAFPKATIMSQAWQNCFALTSFPFVEFPEATQFVGTWGNCRFKTFPALHFPKGQIFTTTWSDNPNLTDFPAISCPSATNFNNTWRNCTALTGFQFNEDTFSKMNSGVNSFLNVTLPTHTWSAILTSVAATNNNLGVIFHGGNSKRNYAGNVAYETLTGRGWTITDGGIDTPQMLLRLGTDNFNVDISSDISYTQSNSAIVIPSAAQNGRTFYGYNTPLVDLTNYGQLYLVVEKTNQVPEVFANVSVYNYDGGNYGVYNTYEVFLDNTLVTTTSSYLPFSPTIINTDSLNEVGVFQFIWNGTVSVPGSLIIHGIAGL